MGKFDIAIKVVLDNEGLGPLENIKGDQPTHFGLIQDDLDDAISKNIVTKDTTLKNLMLIDAMFIYQALYYNNCPNLDKIESQAVVTKILDMRVNLGPNKGIKILQRAINNIGLHTVAEDGVMGPHTTNAVNNTRESVLLKEIRHFQTKYYNDIVNQHPEKMKFLRGWQNRVISC